MDVLHTALWVSDLDETRAFYEGTLGLSFTRDLEGDDGVYNYFVAGESDTEIQFKPVDDGDVDPGGIDHVAVAVESVDDVLEELDDDRVTDGPMELDELDVRIAFVTDPDGYGVELIEDL
jgi:lactoylglutathione lyase